MTQPEKRALIEKDNPDLSVKTQAKLLDISRSSFCHKPIVDKEDIEVMNLIDKIYTAYPYYGTRRMVDEINIYYPLEFPVGRKRIRRLMREMGIEDIYPKPNLSKPNEAHEIYQVPFKRFEYRVSQSSLGDRYHVYKT